MSLLDDLRNLLTKYLHHVESLTNQGTVHLVQDHLTRLAAVGPDITAAEEEVHKVLGELYAALDAPAPDATSAPVVDESGPEPVSLPADVPAEAPSSDAAPVEAEPTPEPAAEPAPEDDSTNAAA